MSDAAKKDLSDARKVLAQTPAGRERMGRLSSGNVGRKHSASTRELMHKSQTDAWLDPAIRETRTTGIRRFCSTSENKDRLRAATTRRWEDPEFRNKCTAAVKKASSTPDGRRRRSDAAKIRWSDPDFTAKARALIKERWADPVWRRMMLDKLHQANRGEPSGLHSSIKAALIEAGIFTTTHVMIGHWCIDEMDSERRIAIEINGCYWHGCTHCIQSGRLKMDVGKGSMFRKNTGNDKRKRKWLNAHGFVLVEIWEHEWAARSEDCIQRVANAIQSIPPTTQEIY